MQLVDLLPNGHVIYLEADWALADLHLFLALLAAHIVELMATCVDSEVRLSGDRFHAQTANRTYEVALSASTSLHT